MVALGATGRVGWLVRSPFPAVYEDGVPQEDKAEEVRSPGPGRSPVRPFRNSISMKGTLSPGFCNSQKPAGVAYKDVLNAGDRWFPPCSQSVALAARMGLAGKELPPAAAGIQREVNCGLTSLTTTST